MKLKSKVALITGSGGSIGGAAARLFAEQGAKIVINDINMGAGQQVAEQIRNAGGEATFVAADISKVAETQKLIDACVESYGRLDILFNNAGIELIKPLHEYEEEDYDRVMDVSLKGSFFCTRYAIPQMVKQGGGVILNMGSIAALNGHAQLASYCAAKGALVNFTKYVAIEYAPDNIRCNCLCPGTIATDMVKKVAADYPELVAKNINEHALGRMGEEDEVATAALFLASDDASYITGVSLPVDGGYLAGKTFR